MVAVNAVALALLATTASAVIVEVGKQPLTISPKEITAGEGEEVQFRFWNTHYIASGPFDRPCNTAQGAIFSGLQEVGPQGDGQEWVYTVTNASQPIWLYCGVQRHCQGGMVAVINPPNNPQRTIEAYTEAAKRATTGQPPPEAVGGEFRAAQGEDESESDPSSTPTGGDSTPTGADATPTPTNAAASIGQNALGTSVVIAVAGAFAHWLL